MTPILATKLYVPRLRPQVVIRPRLLERLNGGLHRKLILISAPAGFGKTTLVSEWVLGCERPTAWLSLDEGDNDPTRFLTYLVAALQTIVATIGEGVSGVLRSPQPPPTEAILTALLNDLTTISDHFVLVLDDYHMIDAKPVDHILTFLLEHLPPHMHLVIATREDPHLPLARLRVRDQLTELRVADLRFTPSEATEFFTWGMGLTLSAEDIALLSRRTEGWIAGLQLAAISLQGQQDATSFIRSFTGSHHFVMDYLVEEVLGQQTARVQTFLLRTSILGRLCGPLCDAILMDPSVSGQETLEYLEHANLFIVALDNERCWYRYHHLFADALRQRLQQCTALSPGDVAELHRRASLWYEDHGLELEAFHHAAATNDVEHAAHLLEGKGMPLHFRGAVAPVLNWLESLPKAALDARPSLWVMYASVLSMTNQLTGVEQKLQAAEAALQGAELDDKTRNLVGHIAAIRALLAATQNQVEPIIAQSRRALEYLHPDNLPVRTATTWKLGWAYQLQGDRAAASRAYAEAISISQASGNTIIYLSATVGLGTIQEADNQLSLAAQTYRRVLQVAGDPPQPAASEAHLGLARICYEWNDLDAAQQHAQQGIQLARQIENTDRFVAGEVLLARLKLAQGDVAGAAALLAEAGQSVREQNFMYRLPEVAAAQVLLLLHEGNLAAAAHLAQMHELPISQARVYLARGNTSAALAVLSPWRRLVEAKGWEDERLKVRVLQVVALQAHGEQDKAVHLLLDALTIAEPSGFIRLFVDEGLPMAQLLAKAGAIGIMPDYIGKLLVVCEAEKQKREDQSSRPPAQSLIEPLSQRELEVLHLIAQGLSNQEISERLFLALDTVKGHNRKIFGKLHVQRRTEAVARARELGLL
ncbi:LuxR family transcriptional regulator [Ktedonobacter sp. SOSP1-85]|uniref:LuxR C-terminal-related transcriptional regulator n=1 Tax=Ktedonobacter sp. SOSP1-85 TaxID=2778367 RepID=UPI0019162039|nr:LuxR C-terminal-related transcriptional regulator [Ktedonobacter sp. SOSP1-85]GHO79935.1 LuxR family transcriptional regulator [Ktedonobacter sp. SOSP1-85]